MNFENELEKRLSSVRQQEQEMKECAKQYKMKQDLILKAKDVIDSVLQITADKFKNASTKPTHDKDPSTGEVIFTIGTGYMCYIDFKQDNKFGFSQPCRLAFQVGVKDINNQEVVIKSIYDQSPDALRSFVTILKLLNNNSKIVFSGHFNAEQIKENIQKEVLKTLDTIRVN